MQQDESRNAAISESRQQRCTTTYYSRFNTAFLGPKTKVPMKQSSKRKSVQQNALKLVVVLLPPKKEKASKQTTTPTPPPPQNKTIRKTKNQNKTIKSEQKIADKQKENGQNVKKKL
jgi:hypothetical protein